MNTIKNLALALTPKQIELLSDALSGYQDEGPSPEGWRSKELEELIELVNQAIGKVDLSD